MCVALIHGIVNKKRFCIDNKKQQKKLNSLISLLIALRIIDFINCRAH